MTVPAMAARTTVPRMIPTTTGRRNAGAIASPLAWRPATTDPWTNDVADSRRDRRGAIASV